MIYGLIIGLLGAGILNLWGDAQAWDGSRPANTAATAMPTTTAVTIAAHGTSTITTTPMRTAARPMMSASTHAEPV